MALCFVFIPVYNPGWGGAQWYICYYLKFVYPSRHPTLLERPFFPCIMGGHSREVLLYKQDGGQTWDLSVGPFISNL